MSEQPVMSRGLTALDAAISLIAILLVVQMWLLTASLEAYLAGHYDVAVPAAVISAVLFVSSFALYRFIESINRSTNRSAQ